MRFNIPEQHKNDSGIYIIRNLIDNKVYVGSAVNFRKRFNTHRSKLTLKNHCNDKLLHSVLKYGIDNFFFDLIELCNKDSLVDREQHWIDKFDAFNKGLNCRPVAHSTLGYKHSEEAKNKIAKTSRGRRHRPESIEKIRQIKLEEYKNGRPKLSAETQAKATQKRVEKLKANRKIILRNCAYCKKEFEDCGFKEAKEENRCCSTECALLLKKMGITVIQTDLKGNTINTFLSIKECTMALGISSNGVYYRAFQMIKKKEKYLLKFEGNVPLPGWMEKVTCSHCNIEFLASKHKKRKFCSNRCQLLFLTTDYLGISELSSKAG